VRRQIRRQNLKIKLKGIEDPAIARELIEGGKQDQVPCLRIEKNGSIQWLYESDAINQYLIETFPN
jgi:glutathione S-transferase